MPVGIGTALVAVGTEVLIMPADPVAVVTADMRLVAPIFNVPPAVVVKVVIDKFPSAVSMPEVLLKFKVP